jgi:hypothetical protein
MRGGEHPGRAIDLDLDAAESSQGEHDRGSGLREQPFNQQDGRLVPQRQRHRCREALGRHARCGKR